MLLDRHATLLLREYRRIFRPSDEAGGLDNVGRRFAFFQRVLRAQADADDGLWPAEWHVGEWIVARFAEMTVCVLLRLARLPPRSCRPTSSSRSKS